MGYDNVEYKFASSNNFEQGLRPQLSIQYAVPDRWQTAVFQKGRSGYAEMFDATINRWQPNTRLGNSSTLNLSWRDNMNDPAEDQRALMRFWLSGVPAEATVQQAGSSCSSRRPRTRAPCSQRLAPAAPLV
ncbi:MAG: hypothetical protein HZY76_16790 [Anaerolineae bacterium]|nr:MAG: hypothetical protein HZY76_16790 [Anaerolineae bacterium]